LPDIIRGITGVGGVGFVVVNANVEVEGGGVVEPVEIVYWFDGCWFA
jgi:hypothetical protein